jgi:hypothetical protein
MEPSFINSELHAKATASLNEEVEKDLKVEDPDTEKAKGILEGKEKSNNETQDNQ